MTETAPFGSWRSPITASMVAGGATGLSAPQATDGHVYWFESRPLEGGRSVLVRRDGDGAEVDVTPQSFNLRTRVHEYGGTPFVLRDGFVFFSNFEDQRLYRQPLSGGPPVPITAEPATRAAHRYGDLELTPDGAWLLCVRERHEDDGVVNELVALPSDGSEAPRILVHGNDFYSSPRVSPDGLRLAWITWNHPNMPWDGTELWTADLTARAELGDAALVAGGPSESVSDPAWNPDGVLHLVSDRTGWWNLYRVSDERSVEPLMETEAEFTRAQWLLGTNPYTFLDPDRLVCVYSRDGRHHLAVLDVAVGRLEDLDVPFTVISGPTLHADGGTLYLVGASPTEHPAVTALDLGSGAVETLKRSTDLEVDAAYVSPPQAVQFPTEDGAVAHAFHYPPTNPEFSGPELDRPPLLVVSHGGPTGLSPAMLNLAILYWTSRGFAVVDVNYRGSTGYGRGYRDALKGVWGVADVDDCINAARFLGQTGEADEDRLCIRGGSAGGYTTLCALTFRDVFAAGASYYGIGDLETMVRDTHKFESRYLDSLIGPYPEAVEVYRERSPIHHIDRLSTPVIIFQGLEDEVVPPNQAEDMVAALRAKGIPFAYVAFEGESHGFRKAENIERSLEAELFFYSKVFGFDLADPIEPVDIENL